MNNIEDSNNLMIIITEKNKTYLFKQSFFKNYD